MPGVAEPPREAVVSWLADSEPWSNLAAVELVLFADGSEAALLTDTAEPWLGVAAETCPVAVAALLVSAEM